MATTKVSALSAKTSLAGSEELLINDGGTSKKSTVTAVRTGITDATKLPLAGGQMTGNITMSGSQTVDGRDVSADGTQLDTNTSAIATKAPIASPTFTGTVAIPNIGNLEAVVSANTAKVTNATHTGDVTGATALTIAADAVTTAKILDDNVTADKLAADAVVTASIVDLNVTEAKIAANSITATKIPDGSITATQIGANAVTLAKMASGTDGNIISYDASGNPVAVATGSSGQVLTSAGAGSPPTFAAALITTSGLILFIDFSTSDNFVISAGE